MTVQSGNNKPKNNASMTVQLGNNKPLKNNASITVQPSMTGGKSTNDFWWLRKYHKNKR